MARKATKVPNNVYYIARMNAVKNNNALSSREGVEEISKINRKRIIQIETGEIIPYQEEALLMSKLYDAPELCNYYCSHQCPIGCLNAHDVKLESIDRILIKAAAGIGNYSEDIKQLLDIFKDAIVSEDEKPQLTEILHSLDYIVSNAEALKLWCRKNLK